MNNYKDKIEEILLAVMPYSFVKEDGSRGALNKMEFYGEKESGLSGSLGYVLDIVKGFIKGGYRKGFLDGTKAAIASLPEDVATRYLVEEDLNKFWADKRWEAYQKEIEEE